MFYYINVMKENWKDVINYEGIYQVSDIGRVKCLKRKAKVRGGGYRTVPENIKTNTLGKNGYCYIGLSYDGNTKYYSIHNLMGRAFIDKDYVEKGLVIDHINNRIVNFRLITPRENTNKKHLKSSSEYTGVSWNKASKKWFVSITINKKYIYIGLFVNEEKASEAYQEVLKAHDNNQDIEYIISRFNTKRKR